MVSTVQDRRVLRPNSSVIDEIPWDQLAFHTVRDTLLQLSEDLKTGQFRLHCIDRDETPVSARI